MPEDECGTPVVPFFCPFLNNRLLFRLLFNFEYLCHNYSKQKPPLRWFKFFALLSLKGGLMGKVIKLQNPRAKAFVRLERIKRR